MSQNSLTIEFGLGAASMADSIIVSWPSGYVEAYTHVAADQRLTLRELDGVAVAESPASGPPFQLASPAPNPARGTTSLRFAIPGAARVRLYIYDVSGRLVTTLVDGVEDAGWHSVSWDRRNWRGVRVSVGVYMAKLEALARTETRKVVMLQ